MLLEGQNECYELEFCEYSKYDLSIVIQSLSTGIEYHLIAFTVIPFKSFKKGLEKRLVKVVSPEEITFSDFFGSFTGYTGWDSRSIGKEAGNSRSLQWKNEHGGLDRITLYEKNIVNNWKIAHRFLEELEK